MFWIFYLVIGILILGLALFFICREYIKKPEAKLIGKPGIIKNKKTIESMVANVESIIVYANGNDQLCNRLVEAKDNVRFFNPSNNSRVVTVDQKLANKLDDLKIAVAKDNQEELCFRLLEEVEALIVQRKKEEQS